MRLITVIDASENGNYLVISVFAIEEGRVNQIFQMARRWIKHSKKLGRKKAGYYEAFPQRFAPIRELSYYSNAFRIKKRIKAKEFPKSFYNAIDKLVPESSLIIVDNKIYTLLTSRYPGMKNRIIQEGNVKKDRYPLLVLTLIADNIANYVRLYGDYKTIRKE
ncbi:hypothetical protein [Pyrococcus kukulkanii]|uniref:Nuclease n=1 Tax=Pyrococcus kukulkanii TaxID=1609559 RepID=A0ABV4T8H9_9EURY